MKHAYQPDFARKEAINLITLSPNARKQSVLMVAAGQFRVAAFESGAFPGLRCPREAGPSKGSV
jgi:hypothetical protein